MARGFAKDEVPRRPTRRADSRRSGARPENDNYGYSNSAAYSHHRDGDGDGGGGSSRRQRSPARTSAYAGGHYAESPILMPSGSERTLAIVPRMPHVTDPHAPPPPPQSRPRMHRRTASEAELASKSRRGHAGLNPSSSPVRPAGSSATLPHPRERSSLQNGSRLSSSRPLPPPGSSKTVSMVTRSRSLTSRPAGVAVYHPNNGAPNVHTTEIFPIQPRPGTRMSSKSAKSHPSSTLPNNTTKAGVVVETMSAPNPFCPNTRGVCCLMVLVNLAIILVAIGFIIVLQLHDPTFVWNIGVVILCFGFFTVLCALVYCMCICQESAHPKPGQPAQGELYWTHHWQKNITIPEIKHRNNERYVDEDHFPEDDRDRLSDTSGSSRDYPRLYLESDYGQRTDREADLETEQEGTTRYSAKGTDVERGSGRHR